jgi:ADP-heptose:LPS heptosyltransferase
MSLIITEPEKEWGATLVSRFKELVQEAQKTAKIIIHPLSQRSQLPGLMKNSSTVITHCSGFSHMSHIFNKNVVTFTMDDSISFINGKNPWAPAKSMIIRKANLADDVNQLVNSSL